MDFSAVLALYEDAKPFLVAVLISLVRPYAFITYSQLLAPSAVPRMARTAAILVITIPLVPINIAFAAEFDMGVVSLVILFAKEFAIGFIMGYLVSWVFWAIQSVGAFIDNQRGAAIAASVDPLLGHETSPLGILFSQAFVTYFFASGGFLLMLSLLYESFSFWPIARGVPLLIDEFPAMMLEVFDTGFRLMFVLAAPVIAIMFLAEFALAIVSRFAPQLQVFILAMPIKSGIAIFILVFYIGTLFDVARQHTLELPSLLNQFYSILETGSDILERFDFRDGAVTPAPPDGDPGPGDPLTDEPGP